jgi:membrane fusion protein (multidrug efflux system)
MLIVLVALAVVFGGIFGWKHRQAQQQSAQAAMPVPPATVAAAEVQVEHWQPYLLAVGSLVATQGVNVTNEVPGQVKTIEFDSGQYVEEGEPLLKLENSVDQADLAGLVAARRLAELRFQRAKKLVSDRSMSRQEYDEAAANLDRARAEVESKQALIQKKQIRAPFAGQLGIRQVNLGEYLAPGSPIVLLQALNPIFVDYSLPERYLADAAPGQAVVLSVQAYPGESFKGRITAISPGIDPATRNVRIRATLENPDMRLHPGMFADVRTVFPESKRVLVLPQSAITYNPYGDSVFVIKPKDSDLIVERRQVETGEVRNGRVEIVKGLTAGDRVVAAGQVKLRNGQSIAIEDTVVLDGQMGTT